MKTHENHLILSFYKSLEKDVNGLLPELCLSRDWEILHSILQDENGLHALCTLGKGFEQALITPDMVLPVPPEFPVHEGSSLPEFFYELFTILFHEDGLRRHDGVDVMSMTNSHIVLILRQILLAFSKLIDVEPKTKPEAELAAFAERIQYVGFPSYFMQANPILRLARIAISNYFGYDHEDRSLDPAFEQWIDNPFGRHGPGAVAGRDSVL
jgi:hypothetical protein